MDVSDTWVQAELAVNRFDAFCIERKWSFVPSPANRDFGKDCYVDLSENGTVTGDSFFVQIKGGRSYAAGGEGYRIPVTRHLAAWRESPAAVIGIVHDPADGALRWVNLTAALRETPTLASVYVAGEALLGDAGQVASLVASVRTTSVLRYAPVGFGGRATSEQGEAVWEAFGLGHHDSAPLIALRRSFMAFDRPAARDAVYALSHFTPHPDIAWNEHNRLPPPIRHEVASTFRWSIHEVWQLLSFVEPEGGMGRGTIGQCVFMLLVEDPDIMRMLERVIAIADDEGVLCWAAAVALHFSGRNAREVLGQILDARPDLVRNSLGVVLVDTVNEHGNLDVMG